MYSGKDLIQFETKEDNKYDEKDKISSFNSKPRKAKGRIMEEYDEDGDDDDFINDGKIDYEDGPLDNLFKEDILNEGDNTSEEEEFDEGQKVNFKLEKEGHNPYNTKNYYPFDNSEFTFGDESNRQLMEYKKKYEITQKRNLDLQSSIRDLEKRCERNKEMYVKAIMNHICSVRFVTSLIKKRS